MQLEQEQRARAKHSIYAIEYFQGPQESQRAVIFRSVLWMSFYLIILPGVIY